MTNEEMYQANTGAILSDDRVYRYALWRRFIGCATESRKSLVVIGLNPSTADENEDDPTIRRCIGFAKSNGCNGLIMMNLFAFRATDPGKLKRAVNPIGPENDSYLSLVAGSGDIVVCAWGTHPAATERAKQVREMLGATPLFCWGQTKGGAPKHPLYLRADTPLQPM